MGRILYGVQGDTRGHVTRARALAAALPGHEFVFVGGGAVDELHDVGHVEQVPMLANRYVRRRIAVGRTLSGALGSLRAAPSVVAKTARLIRSLDPDLILTDFELFTPLAARSLRRRVASFSHQHVLTHCHHARPPGQHLNRLLSCGILRGLHSFAQRYLVSSFFEASPRDPRSTEVHGPLVRPEVLAAVAHDEEHGLVYQTSPTFEALIPLLEANGRPFRVYGMGERASRGRIVFKPPSTREFLADLASCAYVVCNGSHGVFSEALVLGKPVLAFPIGLVYEQLVNAHNLALAGYGELCLPGRPDPAVLGRFESRLPSYREQIRTRSFVGNARITARMEELVAGRWSRRGPAR